MARLRTALIVSIGLVTSVLVVSGPAEASPPTAVVQTITPVNAASETTSFRVKVPELMGTYSLTWTAGDGLGGSSSGDLDANGLTPAIPIDATGVADGNRAVTGTITVVDPLFGTYDNIPLTGGNLTIDRVAPQVAAASSTRQTIYPRIARGGYPGQTAINVTLAAPGDQVMRVFLRLAGGEDYLMEAQQYDAQISLDWDGRRVFSAGQLMPAGLYTVVIKDWSDNETVTDVVIQLSSLHEENRVWKRTFTPQRTLVDRYVGRCSTLRKPSARGWAGSIGYYSNTRCGTQTARASAVIGIHAVVVPKAHRYGGVFIYANGGAATSRPRSTAMLGAIDTEGEIRGSTRMQARIGRYKTRYAQSVVFPDRSIGWLVRTVFGERYDVKTFTVELGYTVLVP